MYNTSLFTGGDSSKLPGSAVSAADFKTRATNCALLTITIVCVCIMVVCGVMIVREYALSKDYEATECRMQNITYSQYTMKCVFCATGSSKEGNNEKGKGACVTSRFPCVLIQVSYRTNGGRRETGILHPDSLQAAGAYSQCSYNVCYKNLEENTRAVEEYADKWRHAQSPFTCYYHPLTPAHVIKVKHHDGYDVLHAMLWPSLVILVCGLIFLRLETLRRGIHVCATSDPTDKQLSPVKQQPDNMLQVQANADLQNKVTCKIVPAQDTDHLLAATNNTAKYNLTASPDKAGSRGGKGVSGTGGRKGKSLDKTRGSGMSSSRSDEGYQQLESNSSTRLTTHDPLNFRQDSCSSTGSKGHETPV